MGKVRGYFIMLCISAVVTVCAFFILKANQPPKAMSDIIVTREDEESKVNVLENDIDKENDELAIKSFTQPRYGIVTQEGKYLVYQPNENFYGEDKFSYTTSDGHGGKSSSTVSVIVTPVNDVPIVNIDHYILTNFNEISLSVLDNDSDVDNDDLKIIECSKGEHGTLFISDDKKQIVYAPELNYLGEDTFTYTISDGKGGTNTGTVKIMITGENDFKGFK